MDSILAATRKRDRSYAREERGRRCTSAGTFNEAMSSGRVNDATSASFEYGYWRISASGSVKSWPETLRVTILADLLSMIGELRAVEYIGCFLSGAEQVWGRIATSR